MSSDKQLQTFRKIPSASIFKTEQSKKIGIGLHLERSETPTTLLWEPHHTCHLHAECTTDVPVLSLTRRMSRMYPHLKREYPDTKQHARIILMTTAQQQQPHDTCHQQLKHSEKNQLCERAATQLHTFLSFLIHCNHNVVSTMYLLMAQHPICWSLCVFAWQVEISVPNLIQKNWGCPGTQLAFKAVSKRFSLGLDEYWYEILFHINLQQSHYRPGVAQRFPGS